MSPEGYQSFCEILSFDYQKHKESGDLYLSEKEQIKKTQQLVGLIESGEVFFKDEYEREPLFCDNSNSHLKILQRLKHHIEMLKESTPPWVKEAYWVGCSTYPKEFGYGDGDEFDLFHFYYIEDKTTTGKRDTQIDFILKVIKEFELDPMEIPEGYKQKIKAKCIDSKNIFKDGKPLFTPSGFEHAWSKANEQQLICIKDKKKYLNNQNSP